VARLTTEQNRTSGFSLIFSVSVGTSMLGGILCGYLRQWLAMAGVAMQPADVKRLILFASCAIAIVGLIPVLRLRVPQSSEDTRPAKKGWLQQWNLGPFLLRYLPLMALWSAVLAAFNPFANVYLSRNLHVPMASIGIVFSTVQIVQLCMGLLTPLVFRALGLINGIVATQIVAAIVLGLMAGAANEKLAIALYLTFSAAQWMSSPGLYNLVMNETPDRDRSTAAAWTMFCNALAGSVATAAAGIFITHCGYRPVLLALAIAAFIIALLFRLLISPQHPVKIQP
jgi:predicted MFS family arabinose efflux permease